MTRPDESAPESAPKAPVRDTYDARLEPTPFSTSGTVAHVCDALTGAIARERHTNLEVKGSEVSFLPTGEVSRDAKKGIAYTRHALTQLVEKVGGLEISGGTADGVESSPSKFAHTFLWARAKLRQALWAELAEWAPTKAKSKMQIFRVALDTHGNHPSNRFYARAVTSVGHSQITGDDSAFVGALRAFVWNFHSSEFAEGSMSLRRDPAGDTTGRIDSMRVLSGHARARISFKNNEVGNGSASVAITLGFEFTLGKDTSYDVSVEIPGISAGVRAIHKGGAVGSMFEAFGESLSLVLAWAPGALARAKDATSGDLGEALLAPLFEGLEGGKLRARQNEIHGFSQALAAYKIADTNSALNLILTLAFFGQATAARDLLSQVSGRCA